MSRAGSGGTQQHDFVEISTSGFQDLRERSHFRFQFVVIGFKVWNEDGLKLKSIIIICAPSVKPSLVRSRAPAG